MKNVFFALAFMLAGTFAFANNSVENELRIENTSNLENTFTEARLAKPSGTCSISIGVYGEDGELLKIVSAKWPSESAADCQREAQEIYDRFDY